MIETIIKKTADGLQIKSNETTKEGLYDYKEHQRNCDYQFERLIIGTIQNDWH